MITFGLDSERIKVPREMSDLISNLEYFEGVSPNVPPFTIAESQHNDAIFSQLEGKEQQYKKKYGQNSGDKSLLNTYRAVKAIVETANSAWVAAGYPSMGGWCEPNSYYGLTMQGLVLECSYDDSPCGVATPWGRISFFSHTTSTIRDEAKRLFREKMKKKGEELPLGVYSPLGAPVELCMATPSAVPRMTEVLNVTEKNGKKIKQNWREMAIEKDK